MFASASVLETTIVTAPAGRPATVEAAATLKVGAKASAQPLSMVKAAVACLAALPLHGVSVATICLVPHVGGFASTACGPPLKLSSNFVNGTCGRSSKTVVIWPVFGSSLTSPASLTCTPWPAILTYRRKPSPKKTWPVSGSSTGVSNRTLPTCDAAGQPAPSNCAWVQAARPSATPGDSAVPTGSAISVRRTCDWLGGSVSVTVAPLGTARCVVSSWAPMPGLKGTVAQPVGVNCADSPLSTTVAGWHDVGSVMKLLAS